MYRSQKKIVMFEKKFRNRNAKRRISITLFMGTNSEKTNPKCFYRTAESNFNIPRRTGNNTINIVTCFH